MQASGSVLTNKYSEGYPGKRYYEGCETIDEVESLAADRATALFGAEHANVQSHSGAQANMGAYFGLLKPGDKVLGMRLDQGGHLTHGSPVNFSGMLYDFVAYGVHTETEVVDMAEVAEVARRERPRMIVAGYSAYSRILDWAAFRAVADEVGALLMVDAAHIIGLIAGGAHPNPVPHADVVTATTHKALRGPRGGLILCRAEHAAAIDKGVFPNAQGGPINNQIAAKAVCFHEASTPEFRTYAAQIVSNASAMATAVVDAGVRVVSGWYRQPSLPHRPALGRCGSHRPRRNGTFRPSASRSTSTRSRSIPAPVPGHRPADRAPRRHHLRDARGGGEEVGRLLATALQQRNDAAAMGRVRSRISELAAAFPPYPKDFPGHV